MIKKEIIQYGIEIQEERNILVEEFRHPWEGNSINNPKQVYQFCCDALHLERKAEEFFYVIATNTKNKVLGVFEISHGTVNTSFANPREIFLRILLCGAASFFCVHNHPSGDCFPSKSDMETTKQLKECGLLMKVYLTDHIIVGRDQYFSFREDSEVL